jgi:hypothetical protein
MRVLCDIHFTPLKPGSCEFGTSKIELGSDTLDRVRVAPMNRIQLCN